MGWFLKMHYYPIFVQKTITKKELSQKFFVLLRLINKDAHYENNNQGRNHCQRGLTV